MNMDKALETLVGTAPSAVAVIITVMAFLRHLKERDVFFRSLHAEHEESRKASRDVIGANTQIMGQHLELGREVAAVLKEVSENMRTCQIVREQMNRK